MDRRNFIAGTTTGSIAILAANAQANTTTNQEQAKEQPMSKGKVLIIVGDATETVDTLYPFYRLIEAGYQPVVAAPEKRLYQMVLHEVKPDGRLRKNGKATPYKRISPLKISTRGVCWYFLQRWPRA